MRYIVFAYDHYYPLGGNHDIKLITNNKEEAAALFDELDNPTPYEDGYVRYYDHVSVLDTECGYAIREKW